MREHRLLQGALLLSAGAAIGLRAGRAARASSPAVLAEPVIYRTPPTPTRSLVVGCTSPKGGAGCTTTAIGLATYIARAGARRPWRVALLDGDLHHGVLDVRMDAPEGADVLDMLLDDAARPATLSGLPGVHLIASPRSSGDDLDSADIHGLLAGLRERYDLVLVDIPSRDDRASAALLGAADAILLHLLDDPATLAQGAHWLHRARSVEGIPASCVGVVCVADDPTVRVRDALEVIPEDRIFPLSPRPAPVADQDGRYVRELGSLVQALYDSVA